MERLWDRLKVWRAAIHYEKSVASFMGVLCLAATADRIKPQQGLERFSADLNQRGFTRLRFCDS